MMKVVLKEILELKIVVQDKDECMCYKSQKYKNDIYI